MCAATFSAPNLFGLWSVSLQSVHPLGFYAKAPVPVVVTGGQNDLHVPGHAPEDRTNRIEPVGIGIREGVVQEHGMRPLSRNQASHRQPDENAELLLGPGAELIELEASVR